MKLYGIASSTCTGRVLLSLFEKEVEDFELVIVNVRKGEGKKPEYLKLQPFGLIPVLEDGDLTLYESRAIIRYIANKYEGQGTALYGKDIKERAKVDHWLEVEGQNFNSAIRRSLGVVSKPPIDEVLLTETIGKLGKVLDIYEDHLSKTQYLAGDFFSLADLSHMTAGWKLFDKYKQGSILFEGRPHVKAWWENISSRPAFKKLLEMI
ncbi:unnamed protein product [Sphagnum balticum]